MQKNYTEHVRRRQKYVVHKLYLHLYSLMKKTSGNEEEEGKKTSALFSIATLSQCTKRIMKEFLLNRAYSYVIMMKIAKTVEKVDSFFFVDSLSIY